ncbi:MAG: hypothetical protein JXR85_03000 [Deltaproteobacteria bacterium]|nr:hypothetical protein [Deltaproteobacteria bacterium]
MIVAIKAVEGLTKATILAMFHIWYIWGCWLSRYITINEESNDSPLSYHFDDKHACPTVRKEDKL